MMAIRRFDLHTHTTASDGALTSTELVRAALEQDIDLIVVTDHDTVAGIAPAVEFAANTPLRVLPGIEVSVLHEGHSIHLLGYGIDPQTASLATHLGSLKQGREERARTIVDLLGRMGAPIPWERVADLGRGAIGRPHIARVLIEHGFARDFPDAFDRFIGPGCPAYLPSGRLSPAEAIGLVREAGGEAALAHAMLLDSDVDLDSLLDLLQAAGMTGLEVYHTEHDAAATQQLRRIAEERDLWWCGGSDFHGPSKPRAHLGGVVVPLEVLEQGPFRQQVEVAVC
jgi:predicted metal-dependent phosphoesterase TrpH